MPAWAALSGIIVVHLGNELTFANYRFITANITGQS